MGYQDKDYEHGTFAVQGCSRQACDCEVHARPARKGRTYLPSSPIRIVRDLPRAQAVREYRRQFHSIKVIASII